MYLLAVHQSICVWVWVCLKVFVFAIQQLSALRLHNGIRCREQRKHYKQRLQLHVNATFFLLPATPSLITIVKPFYQQVRMVLIFRNIRVLEHF